MDISQSAFELLSNQLNICSKLTQKLLMRVLSSGDSSDTLGGLAKDILNCTNIVSAITFYREFKKDFSAAANSMPPSISVNIITNMRTVWNHLERLSDSEIAELNLQALEKLTELEEKVNAL